VAGYTMIELVFVVGLAATLSVAASGAARAALDEYRAAGAARYLSSRLQQARMEAALRGADVAVRFVPDSDSYRFTTYIDGNASGVLARDIQAGIDRPLDKGERLIDQFPGVEFAAAPDAPAIDPGGDPPGDDPIRAGAGNMITFTPLGTSSSGSLFLRGGRRIQYVVRVFAETGKTRILKLDRTTRRWLTSWP
jgi:hypothetical protein